MSEKNVKRHPRKGASALMVALIAFVVVLALILALIAGVWLYFKNYKPSLDTDTPPFDVNVTPDPDDTSPDDGTDNEDEYIRDTSVVNFLVAGRDKAAWNTDVMMLVSFNMRDYTLNVLQIPRDTYIEVDGVTRGRINTVVKLMRSKAYNEDSTLTQEEMLKAGMQGTVEILEKNMCTQTDGYEIVNLEGFRDVITAIGGV